MKKILFALLSLCSLLLYAADVSVRTPYLNAELSCRGGAILELKSGKNSLVFPGNANFTERIFTRKESNVEIEDFSKLTFSLDSHQTGYQADTSVTFSAAGIAGHDWLRVTKKYHFPYRQNKFFITYILSNRDKAPHSAGVWMKTFLTNYDESGTSSRLYLPRRAAMVELTHPGNAVSDEWAPKSHLALAAVQNNHGTNGLLLLPQPDITDGFYAWCGNAGGKPLHTFEFITRELSLAPGQKISFTIEVLPSRNVKASIDSLLVKAAIPAVRQGKTAAVLPDDAGKLLRNTASATKTQLQPKNFTDLTITRQFTPSLHSIILPKDANPARIAVYPVSNRNAEMDRPLPVKLIPRADGTQKLLFQVPGLNKSRGLMYSKIVNGYAYDTAGMICLGEVQKVYRVALDAPVASPQITGINAQATEPNLIYNSGFEKPNKAGDFVDGYYWQNLVRKGYFTWAKGEGYKGSSGIRVQLTTGKDTAAFSAWYLVEGGKPYSFGAFCKSENFDKNYVILFIQCYDKNGKPILSKGGKVYALNGHESFDWALKQKRIILPAEATKVQLCAQLSRAGRENILWIDDLFLRPEEPCFNPKSPLETAKETAILNGYTPLPLLEKINENYVTPHVTWMKPAAFTMPEVLYCATIINSNEDAQRRTIVELRQRLNLPYQFIPLLPRSKGGAYNEMGVGDLNLDNCIEGYTLERFHALKSVPKCAIIQGLNFKKYDANGAFTAELDKLQKRGTRFLFVNCSGIPTTLLGTRQPIPTSWELVPHMNNYNSIGNLVTCYEKASVFNYGDAHYIHYGYFPSTPVDQRQQTMPAYFSKDFPFWEYPYLPLLKAIRAAGGIVSPAEFSAIQQNGNALAIQLQAAAPTQNLTLAVEYKTLWRETIAAQTVPLYLQPGINQTTLSLPASLGGGEYIAHIFLQASDGKKWDAAAVKVANPETNPLQINYAKADRIFRDKKVDFTITASQPQQGDTLRVVIEDVNGRQVYLKEIAAKAQTRIQFQLLPPFTTLYRVYATHLRGNRTVARLQSEFSIGALPLDPTEQHAGMWGGRLILSGMLRNLGFELISVDGNPRRNAVTDGLLRNILNLDAHPFVLNYAHIIPNNGRLYRADIASAPVRTPCFSDPDYQAKIAQGIAREIQKNQLHYYGGIYFQLGDEQFLGSTVCFSEHCLADFRRELKQKYGKISLLNQKWGTNFASFEQVVPQQLKELKSRSNLAPWQEHKLFMARVFAHKSIGALADNIRKAIPEACVGLSGTQVPGYGYDWAQLMKHMNCIAYYNGVQTALVNEFHKQPGLFGQWGGGYVGSDRPYGAYQVSGLWSNLFKGANTAWNWHGTAYNGDGSPTENLAIYCSEVALLRSGITKLVLSADARTPEVAVLYSQPSLFTAIGSELGKATWQNTQTGWDELLRDLKVSFTFITYEDLANPQLQKRGFKAIILPMALSLSQKESEQLHIFAQNGGLVLADIAPGRYDETGKRCNNPILANLFPANEAAINLLPKDLNQGTLRGRFQIAEPSLPLFSEMSCGAGKGILMNLGVNSYQALTIGGVGGELATAKSGTGLLCESLRKTMGAILQKHGILPFMEIKDARGNAIPCQAVHRSAGNNHLYGLLNHSNDMSIYYVDPAKGEKATVTFPVSGVIYDCRLGKKIGTGNQITTILAPAYGQLYAVLPQEITSVKISITATPTRGQLLKFSVKADGAQGPTVYHTELVAPDGSIARCYQKNIRFEDPEGQVTLQLPFNAPKGTWTIRAKHVASGVTASKNFILP